jgi:PTS system N-acetylglucosamine-specific IIC component
MALMDMLHVKLGFGFSAGLFDYVLNFNKATRPWLLLSVGLAYFGVYYGLFTLVIRVFDLKTPGREAEGPAAAPQVAPAQRGEAFAKALGGSANLLKVDACTTRLRLQVRDQAAVDEPALRALGARGLVRPSAETLQVVLGPQADQVAGEIRASLAASPVFPRLDGDAAARAIMAALPQADFARVDVRDSRLCLALPAAAAIDEAALRGAGLRGIFRRGDRIHLLVGPTAGKLAEHIARTSPPGRG